MSDKQITQEIIDAMCLKNELNSFDFSMCNPSIPCHVQSPKVRIAIYTVVRCFLEREIPEQSFNVRLSFKSKFPQIESKFKRTWWFSETMSSDKKLSEICFVVNDKQSDRLFRECGKDVDLFFAISKSKKVYVNFHRVYAVKTNDGERALGGHRLKKHSRLGDWHNVLVFYLQLNYKNTLKVLSHELAHVKQAENEVFDRYDHSVPHDQRPEEIDANTNNGYADSLKPIINEKILATSVYDLL